MNLKILIRFKIIKEFNKINNVFEKHFKFNPHLRDKVFKFGYLNLLKNTTMNVLNLSFTDNQYGLSNIINVNPILKGKKI